jgi:hypothetical protein
MKIAMIIVRTLVGLLFIFPTVTVTPTLDNASANGRGDESLQ